jgi:hypothetical protein
MKEREPDVQVRLVPHEHLSGPLDHVNSIVVCAKVLYGLLKCLILFESTTI